MLSVGTIDYFRFQGILESIARLKSKITVPLVRKERKEMLATMSSAVDIRRKKKKLYKA